MMNIRKNHDNLPPTKERKQRPRWLATPALHLFSISTGWITKFQGHQEATVARDHYRKAIKQQPSSKGH